MIIKWVVVQNSPFLISPRFYAFFLPFLLFLNDFTPKISIFAVFLFLKIVAFLNFHSLP
jgi:hypothetical protein